VRVYACAQRSVRKMLLSLCDAVVQLGPDLHIQGPSPQLASLLLATGGGCMLDGADFTARIATEQDRDRFKSKIAEAAARLEFSEPGGLSSTPPLHMHLRDSTGAFVSVEIFHVHFPDLDGLEEKPCHLIGLREEQSFAREMAGAAEPLPQIIGRQEQGAASVTTSSNSSGTFTMPLALQELEEIVFHIDALSLELPVQQVNFKFAAPSEDRSFHDDVPKLCNYLPDAVKDKLVYWIQGQANASFSSHDVGESDFGVIDFQLPGGPMLRGESAVFELLNIEDSGLEDLPATVTIRGFWQHRHRHSNGRRRRSKQAHLIAIEEVPSTGSRAIESCRHPELIEVEALQSRDVKPSCVVQL